MTLAFLSATCRLILRRRLAAQASFPCLQRFAPRWPHDRAAISPDAAHAMPDVTLDMNLLCRSCWLGHHHRMMQSAYGPVRTCCARRACECMSQCAAGAAGAVALSKGGTHSSVWTHVHVQVRTCRRRTSTLQEECAHRHSRWMHVVLQWAVFIAHTGATEPVHADGDRVRVVPQRTLPYRLRTSTRAAECQAQRFQTQWWRNRCARSTHPPFRTFQPRFLATTTLCIASPHSRQPLAFAEQHNWRKWLRCSGLRCCRPLCALHRSDSSSAKLGLCRRHPGQVGATSTSTHAGACQLLAVPTSFTVKYLAVLLPHETTDNEFTPRRWLVSIACAHAAALNCGHCCQPWGSALS